MDFIFHTFTVLTLGSTIRLSRIERGLDEPKDSATLKRIAEVYQLTKQETDLWLELRFGISANNTVSTVDLEYADHMVGVVQNVCKEGNAKLAARIADQVNEWLLEKEKKASSIELRQLQVIQGRILLEKAFCYEHFIFSEDFVNETKPMLDGVMNIAAQCNDQDLLGLAEHHLAQAYYIGRRYHTSLLHQRKALELIKEPAARLRLLGFHALNWAYLGHKQKVKEISQKFETELSNGQFESNIVTVCDAVQALARAKGGVFEDPWPTIELLQKLCLMKTQLGHHAPIRDVQLYHAQVELVSWLEPNNKSLLENLGNKGIQLAHLFGFDRHERGIQIKLEKNLDA